MVITVVSMIHDPVVLYGCESWTVKQKNRMKIKAFEYWCWRRLLGISWTDKRTNQSIREELKLDKDLDCQIDKQKLVYFGHVVRAEGLEKSIMFGMDHG